MIVCTIEKEFELEFFKSNRYLKQIKILLNYTFCKNNCDAYFVFVNFSRVASLEVYFGELIYIYIQPVSSIKAVYLNSFKIIFT